MTLKKDKPDFAANAARVVSQAIGEDLFNGGPLPTTAVSPNTPGRKGGLKGGKARAEKLSSAKRHEIAKKAASTRWKK